jgi:phosphate-selective porin OprO/OprP
MRIKTLLMSGTIAGVALAGTAFAKTTPSNQPTPQAAATAAEVEAMQTQLNAMQAQVAYMKRQIELMNEKNPPSAKPAPKITQSASNKFAIESADGQYTIGLTGRLHLDVGDYVNVNHKSQVVGPQNLNSGFNARRARLGITGKAAGDFTYTFIYDAGGSADSSQGVIETAQFAYTGLKGANYNTSFEFGYSDTFFTLEEAMSSNDMLFMERAAPQIVATGVNAGDNRSNIGGRYYDDRLWVGAYVTGPANGNAHGVGETVGAFQRVAYQFLSDPNYSLHLGADLDEIIKPAGAGPGTANTVTLASQPELRIDNTTLLTTGAIGSSSLVTGTNHSVKGGYIAGFEAAGNYGPFYAMGEYYHYSIDRIGLANVQFDGEYVDASYTLTGESRKYNKATGAYGGIVPAHDFSPSSGYWGAFEIAARYSYVDLTSNFTGGVPISATSQPSAINGGKETGYTVGLNWYPNTYMRVMLNYIHEDFQKANPATVTVAGIGTAVIGAPVGTTLDAIALRTQVAW